MTPYLTRKHTSTNVEDSQSRNTVRSSSIVSKAKNVMDKKLKTKDNSRVINTRSVIRTRNALYKKKVDDSVSVDKESTEKKSQRIMKYEQVSKEGINNRVKNDKSIIGNDSINLNKYKSKVAKRKQNKNETSNKNMSNLRQMSLRESFVSQPKKRKLRSSKNTKDLKNGETLTKEQRDTDRRTKLNDCIVLAKKLDQSRGKLPVYKRVPLDNSEENTNEIYEFKFDVNDSKEKLPKKRKKKPVIKKTLLNTKKKNVLEKHNLPETKHKKVPNNSQSEEVKETEELKKVPEIKNDKKVIEKNSVESSEDKVSIEPVSMEDLHEDLKGVSTENIQEPVKERTDIYQSEKPVSINKEQVKDNTTKPTLQSVENLNDKNITIMNNSPISKPVDFQPFSVTNIFKNELAVQQKNMINHSLFERSLSPIKKSSENLEIGSPWRTPQLLTFSQVKNVFQSTPQSRKHEIASNKLVRTLNNEIKPYGSMTNAKNISQKHNENINEEGYVSSVSLKKKNPSVWRKFGTEITNINQSLQSNPGEDVNELAVSEVENMPPAAVQSAGTLNLSANNTFSSGINENKENNISNHQRQQAVKRERKKAKSQSPKKSISNVLIDESKENLDPQPGPSGLQNRSITNDRRVLRQSNLNNFLNIMEMPQSTTIKTPHRIFDDIYSTPVTNNKPRKTLNEASIQLQNAFGFSDEDNQCLLTSVECESTGDTEKQEKAIQTNLEDYNRPIARLSIAEIKNKLLVNRLKEDVKNVENVQTERLDVKKSPIKQKNENKIDITNFFDTFDMLSDMDESVTGNSTSEVPLFADIEPTHFSRPPRYSYKRKRGVKFSLSDESDSEEEKILENETKRRKGNKMKSEQEKRLKNWIENINKTFSEVDQHELVVE